MVISMSEKRPDCASCAYFATCSIKFDDLVEDCQHHFKRSETFSYEYDPDSIEELRDPIRDAYNDAILSYRLKRRWQRKNYSKAPIFTPIT